MADPANPSERKIIVDEDWKTQVQAEEEALRKGPTDAEPAGQEARGPLPPPSLTMLANSLYLQAAIGLGLLPSPLTGKAEQKLPEAKHTIDMLDLLREKTEGNRTPEETEDIDAMLHQLRMAYLSVVPA